MSLSGTFFFAALLCIAGVVISLFGGMIAMAKGQAKDHRASNKMMQMRVVCQSLAIGFLTLAYLAK